MKLWGSLLALLFLSFPGLLRADCVEIYEPVEFCDAPSAWSKIETSDWHINAAFRHESGMELQFSIGDIGSETLEFGYEYRRNALLDRAIQTTGIISGIMLVQADAQIDRQNAQTYVFFNQRNGQDVVEAVTILLQDGMNLYVHTFMPNPLYTDQHAALHQDVLAGILLAPQCTDIATNIHKCELDDGWKVFQNDDFPVGISFSHDSGHYLNLFSIPRAETWSVQRWSEILLETAAQERLVPDTAVLIDQSEGVLHGFPYLTLTLHTGMYEDNFVSIETRFDLGDTVLFASTTAPVDFLAAEHTDLHTAVLNALRIDP